MFGLERGDGSGDLLFLLRYSRLDCVALRRYRTAPRRFALDRQTGLKDGRTDRHTDVRMIVRRTDGQTDGQTDGLRLDGRIGRSTDRLTEGY